MQALLATFPGGSDGKESAHSTGDLDLISGLGRSPVEGNGYLLQYSCLENSMDGGEPCGLQSMGSHRVWHNWSCMYTYIYWASQVALVVKNPLATGDHSYFLVSSIAPITLPKWVGITHSRVSNNKPLITSFHRHNYVTNVSHLIIAV